jgi:hypothetical protein
VLAYLLTHPDVTNCFVPPMAQPIKSKAPQTPQFPALSYQTEQPSSRQWTIYLLVRCGHPSSIIRPIESINNIIWTCGERNSTYQIHSAHCKTPLHLKPIYLIPPLNPQMTWGKKNHAHTHIPKGFFFFFITNFVILLAKDWENLGNIFFSSVNSTNFIFFGKKNSNFSISQLWNLFINLKKKPFHTHKEIHKRRVNQAKGQHIYTQTPLKE